VSADDIWAMNEPQDTPLHWNGHGWHVVSSFAGTRLAQPFPAISMSAASTKDIWAIGQITQPAQANAYHWDGKHWRAVSILPVG
jgi:hypothetical protein